MRKNKLSLARADQLDIDLGQEFSIEQQQIYKHKLDESEARLEAARRANINQSLSGSNLSTNSLPHARALLDREVVEELPAGFVEHCVVRNELRIAEKIYEFSHPARE